MGMQLSEVEWRKRLTPEQYHVLREKGTEVPGTGVLLYNHASGMYVCAACGAQLFKSQAKYDSATPGLTGWPSFDEPIHSGAVELTPDDSLDTQRAEVTCTNCGSHLGHLFPDAQAPHGQHFCINSIALNFHEQP